MEYKYDPETNLVSLKFNIRTGKIEEIILGCHKLCKSKEKGNVIEFSYKRKEKKDKIFYRIKMRGSPKEMIFVIKQLDSMKQMHKFLWSDVIDQIKKDAKLKK